MVEHPTKISNPKQLVDEFKKSGEFDRLRRQLLTHFTNSDEVRPLMSRVEEIVQEKLSRDEQFEHKTREAVHSEVMQDMERYPIVERAVTDLPVLKDDTLSSSIEQYVRNIVRGESNENIKLWEAKSSHRRERDDEDEYNDGSSDYTEDEEPDGDDHLIIIDANRKTIATSQSPEPVNGTPGGEVLHNGRSPPQLGQQPEPMPSTSHPGTPRGQPPTETNAANMSPHTPPWPAPMQDMNPPLSSHNSVRTEIDSGSHFFTGVFSSNSFVGEQLVDSVPARDANEGGNSMHEELSLGREEQSTQRRLEESISPPRQGEEQLETNTPKMTTNSDDLLAKTGGSLSSPRPSSPMRAAPLLSSPLPPT